MALVDLLTAARIAREAACQEVIDSMEAADRYNPAWEIHELGISHSIRNRLLGHFRTFPEPRPRVVQEYSAGVIRNVRIPFDRVFDLAVLYPLVSSTEPKLPGYAWSETNCSVLGLIEVKKDRTRAPEDAERFARIALTSPIGQMSPIQWVLLLVFIAGQHKEHVVGLAKELSVLVSLPLVTDLSPQEAPKKPGSEKVVNGWFDIVGFGKALEHSSSVV